MQTVTSPLADKSLLCLEAKGVQLSILWKGGSRVCTPRLHVRKCLRTDLFIWRFYLQYVYVNYSNWNVNLFFFPQLLTQSQRDDMDLLPKRLDSPALENCTVLCCTKLHLVKHQILLTRISVHWLRRVEIQVKWVCYLTKYHLRMFPSPLACLTQGFLSNTIPFSFLPYDIWYSRYWDVHFFPYEVIVWQKVKLSPFLEGSS